MVRCFGIVICLLLSIASARALSIKANNQLVFDGKIRTLRFYASDIPVEISKQDLKKGLRVTVTLNGEAKDLISVRPRVFSIPLRPKRTGFRLSRPIRFRIKKLASIPESINLSYSIEAVSEEKADDLNLTSFSDSIFVAAKNSGIKISGTVRVPENSVLVPAANTSISFTDLSNSEPVVVSTTDSNGNYQVTLAEGVSLSSQLIASVNIDDTELRAPVVSGVVNIDPISEIVTREIIEEETSITVREANAINDQIATLDLENIQYTDLNGSLTELDDTLQSSLDTITDSLGTLDSPATKTLNTANTPAYQYPFANFISYYHFDSFTFGISANEDGSSPGLDAAMNIGESRITGLDYAWVNMSTSSDFIDSAEVSGGNQNPYEVELEQEPEDYEPPRMLTPGLTSFSPFNENLIAEAEPFFNSQTILTFSGGGMNTYYGYNDVFFIAPLNSASIMHDTINGTILFRKQNIGFDVLTKRETNENNSIFNHTEYKTLSLEADLVSSTHVQYGSAFETLTLDANAGTFSATGNKKFFTRTIPSISVTGGEEVTSSTGTIYSAQNLLSLDFDNLSSEAVTGAVQAAGDIFVYFYSNDNTDPQDSSIINDSQRKIVFGLPSHSTTVDLTQHTYRLLKVYASASGSSIEFGTDPLMGNLTIDSNGVATPITAVTYISRRSSESSPVTGDIDFNLNETYTIISGDNGSLSGSFKGLTLDGFASEDGKVLLMRAAEGSQNTNSTELYFLLGLAL